jgi:phage-related protein
MTAQLDKATKGAEQKVGKMTASFAKNFAIAGTAVAGFIAVTAAGLLKFSSNLAKADDELNKFARSMGLPKEEAYKVKSALDVMGKSMEEIALNPVLMKQFAELKANAADFKLPDMSDALKPFREMATEFLKIKQTATNALQWVGYYFLKYVQKPMDDIKKLFSGFNDTIKKNIPEWGANIGKALAWLVRLGGTLLRGAGILFTAIKRIFDMIPTNVKIVMGVLAALFMFLRMSPIGQFITLLTIALLLLDDFFTYLDGGESLLEPVWETLTNFFSGFEESGRDALSFFTTEFLPQVVDKIREVFPALVEMAMSYVKPFVKFAVEALKGIITAVLEVIPQFVEIAGIIFTTLFDALMAYLPELINLATSIITTLIDGLTTGIPKLIDVAVGIAERIIDTIVRTLPAILEAGVNLVLSLARGIVNALPKLIESVVSLVDRILTALIDALPKLVKAGVDAATSLITGLLSMLPSIAAAALDLVFGLVDTILNNLPGLIKAGVEIVMSLVGGIVSMLPTIIETAISLIVTIIEKIVEYLPKILKAGIDIILSLINGIATAIPDLFQKAISLIPVIVSAITENLPRLIALGLKAVMSLIGGIVEALPKLLDAGLNMVSAVATGLVQAIPEILKAIPKVIGAVLDGFEEIFPGLAPVFDAVKNHFEIVFNAIADIFESVIGIFQNVFGLFKSLFQGDWEGAWEAVKEVFSSVWSTIETIFKAVIDAVSGIIKTFLSLFMDDWEGAWNTVETIFSAVWKTAETLFQAAVDAITSIFKVFIALFQGDWEGAWEIVKDLLSKAWEGIKTVFSMAWEGIKGIFSNVAGWFGDIFSAAWRAITDVWNGVASFFSDTVWGGIKGAFTNVVGWFTDIFSGAWQAVKNAFLAGGEIFGGITEGIYEAFKGIVNSLISGINTVVSFPFNKINEALEGIRTLSLPVIGSPFSWLPTIPVPQIPQMERGGVLGKGQVGFLEGTGAEAVVPLEKNTEWIQKVAQAFMQEMGAAAGGNVEKLAGVVGKLESVMTTLATAIEKTMGGITSTISGGGLAGIDTKMSAFLENANKIMAQTGQSTAASYSAISNSASYDNRSYDQSSTFNISDTSGNPRTTAEMVDRTQSLRIRNMRGAFA